MAAWLQTKGVTGSLYGSSTSFLLTLMLPFLCIFIPPAVLGAVKWTLPVGCAVGCLPFATRTSTLSVTDDGVSLVQAGMTFYVPWVNVESIREGTIGAPLVLQEKRRLGMFSKRRFPVAMFDFGWRTRAPSIAMTAHLSHGRQVPSGVDQLGEVGDR